MISTKFWIQSKLIWLGFVQVFIGLEPTITEFFNTGVYTQPAVSNLIFGCLIIVLRFFTTKKIK